MEVGKLVKLVSRMREAQRQYFRSRSSQDLEDAKMWEGEVDDAIQEYERQQDEKVQPGLGL